MNGILDSARVAQAFVIMGVCGSGKSTVAQRLAEVAGGVYIDADDLHSAEATLKMSRGEPLDDTDRLPWLIRVRDALQAYQFSATIPVVACSALKRCYRDTLRANSDGINFVFLDITPEVARQRISQRQQHFFPVSLINSQFALLERPGREETDCFTVDAALSLEHIVERIHSRANMDS